MKDVLNKLIEITGESLSKREWASQLEELEGRESTDFDVSFGGMEFRIIDKDYIDGIQQEELGSDLYTLGCFNAWFLASILECVDQETIEILQKAEAFEGIGRMVIAQDKLEELQEGYVSADGYGHHFAYYDHEEHETDKYYIFRTN